MPYYCNRAFYCASIQFSLYFLLLFVTVYGQEQGKAKDKYNLHKNCESAMHTHIDEQMRVHLVYKTMAAHFSNNKIARQGFAEFFSKKEEEEHELATKLIDYLNVRGGKFVGFDMKMPARYKWNSGLEALREAISLEKRVNNKLHHLHSIAALQCEDQDLMDFLEKKFFDQRVQSINTLRKHITELKVMDNDMGEYLFDQQLLHEKTEL